MSTAPLVPATNAIYVIGHCNPDANAICSAIAYSACKEARGERGFIPGRGGNLNARNDMILSRFHQPLPIYVSDVWPRVRDLMETKVVTVPEDVTCAEALELIDRNNVAFIPVVDTGGRVVGKISLPHWAASSYPASARRNSYAASGRP